MSTRTARSGRFALRRAVTLVTTTVVATWVAALAAACTGGGLPGGLVVGSGQVTSETREVAAFTEVEANGGLRLELVKGATTAVVVTAQPNLLPITNTRVDGSRLVVDTTKAYTTTEGLTVKVTMPSLAAVTLTGAASASGDGFDSPALALDLSGGARVNLSGTARSLDLTASGGAIVELGKLRATTAKVDLSGGVVATLAVSSTVTGTASGGVVLTLAERAQTVDVQTSGGATVVRP